MINWIDINERACKMPREIGLFLSLSPAFPQALRRKTYDTLWKLINSDLDEWMESDGWLQKNWTAESFLLNGWNI